MDSAFLPGHIQVQCALQHIISGNTHVRDFESSFLALVYCVIAVILHLSTLTRTNPHVFIGITLVFIVTAREDGGFGVLVGFSGGQSVGQE